VLDHLGPDRGVGLDVIGSPANLTLDELMNTEVPC
jgi:hypothetical protein